MYKNYIDKFGVPEGYLRKILLIMRLTTILLLATLLQVSAKTYSQTVTLDVNNASLSEILKEIRQQTGYDFLYNREMLKNTQPVTIQVKNGNLSDVLDKCLERQPLTFKIENKVVLLDLKKGYSFFDKIKQVFTRIDAIGTVIDEQGKPVPGATVKLKNGKGVTLTDEKGRFTITGCNAGDIILISFIGYNAKEVPAAAEMGVIRLEVATNVLDQVVVRAYGETSQRLSVGNISSITAKQIENKPVTNPLLDLQGEVPGIYITQSTGFANSGVNVQIQGPNSLANNNLPLYVIDGVPYSSQNLPSVNSAGSNLLGSSGTGNQNNDSGAQSGNPLSFINPRDIESISVLKDADATSIYGTRAANGAIIITTKKGKVGAGNFSINMQEGVSQYTNFLKLLNTQQYLKLRKDAYFVQDGLTISSPQYASQYDINGVWDTTRYTDWQKILLGGKASYTNLQASLSGGTTLDQYLFSGNYNRQTTVFPLPSNIANQAGSFHVNLNHSSQNQKFKIQFSTQYMFDNDIEPGVDLTAAAFQLAPDAPALYNPDGTLNWQTLNGISTWSNPLKGYPKVGIQQIQRNTTSTLLSNLVLSYRMYKNLVFQTSLGYNAIQQDELFTTPYSKMAPEDYQLYGAQPSNTFSNSHSRTWIVEPQLTYNHLIWKGTLNVLLGGTIQTNNAYYQSISGLNYSSDQLLEDIQAAANLYAQGVSNSEYRYQNLHGRLAYNYEGRYVLNLSANRDGSSRFGGNNAFHDFWSAGGAWIFSEEKLIRERLPWLSFGKINLSYGTTGSDGIADYRFLNQYGSGGYAVGYQGVQTLFPAGLPNPDLQWEETRKLNLGLSLGFLKDHILLKADYYRNRSSNQLLSYVLPSITGFGNISQNFPATVQNTGYEFSLNSTPVQTNNFSWRSSLNLSLNRNELVSFPGIESSSYYSTYIVGKPIDVKKLYRYARVDPQTGLYQVYKADGSTTSSSLVYATDATISYSLLPKYYGGWSNTFNYHGVSLNILFSFTRKTGISQPFLKRNGFFNLNQPIYALDYWKSPGDITTFQRLSSGGSSFRAVTNAYGAAVNSNANYIDGYYASLKNASLSYQLPFGLIKKVGMKSGGIQLSGQNLLMITNFRNVINPEAAGSTLPPLRTITLGINAGF